MRLDRFRIAAAIAAGVGQQPAQLDVGEAFPDHRVVGRGQPPIRRARRCVLSGQIVILMTCAALHWSSTLSVWTTPHIHDVRMQIVSLARVVASGVADEAARMMQHGRYGLEGCHAFRSGRLRVAGGRLRASIECKRTKRDQRRKQASHADFAPVRFDSASAASTRAGVKGTSRRRAPDALKMALPMAAGVTVIEVSPAPDAGTFSGTTK